MVPYVLGVFLLVGNG